MNRVIEEPDRVQARFVKFEAQVPTLSTPLRLQTTTALHELCRRTQDPRTESIESTIWLSTRRRTSSAGASRGSHLSRMPSGDYSPDVRFDTQTHGPQSRLERRLWKNNNPGYRLTLHVGCASLFRSRPLFTAAHVCCAHR